MSMKHNTRKQRRGRAGGATHPTTGIIRAPAERKLSYTGYLSQTDLVTTGTTLISGIAQGDDYTNREGRAVRYLGFDLKVGIGSNQATPGVNMGFWALVLDRQPNGALASFATIFDTAVGLGDAALAPQAEAYIERFRIIDQEFYSITQVDAGRPLQVWHKRYDLDRILSQRDQIERFSNTTAAVGSISTNALIFVYCVSGQTQFGSNSDYAKITFQSALEFQE